MGPAGVAAAFGLAVATMIRVGARVGCPTASATAAFAVGRHFPPGRVLPYWAAQVGGSLAAAVLLRITLGDVPLGVTHPGGGDARRSPGRPSDVGSSLMLVIVAVATRHTRAVGQAAAICVGGTVALGARGRTDRRRASLNPARSLDPAAFVTGDNATCGCTSVAPPMRRDAPAFSSIATTPAARVISSDLQALAARLRGGPTAG